MKKALYLFVALSLIWTYQASVSPASAHGGSYRGPAGETPPGQRDPKDPQPPPENPGTPTPDPGGTPTPDPGGSPTPGGDAPAPEAPPPPPSNPGGPTGGPPGGGTVTGGGAPQNQMSFENWLFWWAYNKDEILNLKSSIKSMENKVSTRGGSHFYGKGFSGNRGETQAPTEAAIQDEIVPALKQVVENKEIHPDIRGGALIALARCGSNMRHVQTFFEIADPKNGEDKVVRESAILALGILQVKNPEIRKFLIDFVDNKDDQFRVRCFAMLALGLLQDNSPEVFECLEKRLDGSESYMDIPVCALMAMGLIGDNAKVPDLLKWLDEGRIGRFKLSDIDRAHLVSALGKIGDPQALKAISDTLKKKDKYTRRSAMLAMGQIVPQLDAKDQLAQVKKLAGYFKNEKDNTSRNFAVISLGRIGGQVDADEAVRTLCVQILVKQFKDGNKTTERPYASLALGLIAFEPGQTPVKPKELKYKLASLIRTELAELKGDKVALGAQATALGMIGDSSKETVNLLVKILQDRGLEKKLRGAAAVALGLIGDNSAKEAILRALREREDRDLRVDTAVAAGLIGDSSAVDVLVKVLRDPKASQFVLGSVALGLGQIGDRRAIGPLKNILEPQSTDGNYPDLTRALVAVALGQIADRRDIRVLARISKDVNYRAIVPALDEILTVL